MDVQLIWAVLGWVCACVYGNLLSVYQERCLPCYADLWCWLFYSRTDPSFRQNTFKIILSPFFNFLSGREDSIPGWSPRANQRWTALFQSWFSLLWIYGFSALCQRKSALFSSVSEKISAETALIQRWFFCSENFQFQNCFRENQRCSALNHLCFRAEQRCFSADFELRKFPFSALFRAESALFRDFQVMNSAETDLKVFWIRADQRWMSLRRQLGMNCVRN